MLSTSWIQDGVGSLNPEQQAAAEGLDAILERLDLPHLDVAASSAVADANGLRVSVHRNRPRRDVHLCGPEEESFRPADAHMGRVWPFPSADYVQATLALVDSLLTERIELHVWKRPLAIKSRSY